MGPNALTTREDFFRQRVMTVLAAMKQQYPSIGVNFDAWRPMVVSRIPGKDVGSQSETWVRLGEGIEGVIIEKAERFYQDKVGIVNQLNHFCLLPDQGIDFRPDDHIIVGGMSYLVQEATTQLGVVQLKINREKSRFKTIARGVPTYRILVMKANIQ